MARLALAAHLTDGETEDEGTSWELGGRSGCDIWFIGLQQPLLGGGGQSGKDHGFLVPVSKGRGSGSGEGNPTHINVLGTEFQQDVKQLELEEQLGP